MKDSFILYTSFPKYRELTDEQAGKFLKALLPIPLAMKNQILREF